MEAIESIMTRRSIRSYTGQDVSDETIRTILTAGMCGPSCTNARDWSFLVVRDRQMLQKMADANGRPAEPLRHAAAGILICGNLERAFPGAKDYWIIDCSIATQNMTLCAHALGLGSVWLGTWPQMKRVEAQRALFALPEHIIPHSILALGYPAESRPERGAVYEASQVHMEKW